MTPYGVAQTLGQAGCVTGHRAGAVHEGTRSRGRSLTPPVARHSKQTPPSDGSTGRGKRRRWGRGLLLTGLVGLLGAFALLGVGYAMTDIPAPNANATAGATRILYSDGSELGRVGGQNRIPVALEQVPEDVQEAILAAEDRNFYTEPGISPRGIARALLTNVRGGGDIQQGGSTITQQYAKNAFLSSERTYTRKVKEVFIALKMTRERTKASILEDYLNTIFFGRGASGIEVASQTYFGKPVSALTPGEGAVLAASIRSPAKYDPEKHPERARERWDFIVAAMIERGWVQPEAVQSYPAVLLSGAANRNNDLSGPKGHVIAKVMEELEVTGVDAAQLASGGLEVKTTLRRPAQDAAVAAVQARVGDGSDPAGLQGALVSVEPVSGAIVAYYGGGTGTGFDYASQGGGNQPGSSFKPYVLAAALEQGISLRSRFDGNSPKDFPGVEDGIENFGDRDHGRVDLLEATQKSVNTAYFELGIEVGPDKVKEFAHRAGVDPDRSPLVGKEGETDGGIALGAYNVSVVDQAAGFGSFAALGMSAEPYFIDRVLRGEDAIYVSAPRVERAFEEDVAADVTVALQAVVQKGTGTKAKLAGGRPAAGKTGTSSKNRDAWFVGFVPQLSTAVWIGNGDDTPLEIDGIQEVTGGGVSSGVWKSYMDVATDGMPEEEFPEPADVGKVESGSSDEETSSPQPRRTRTRAPATTSAEPTESASPSAETTQEPSEPPSSPEGSPAPSSPPPEPMPVPPPPPPPPPEPTPTSTGG